VRLAVHTLERTTFCYPDSVFEPEHVGTATRMDLTRRADEDLTNGVTDDLDSYVEAHVHGVVSLAGDVEAIVLDPVYRGGEVEVLAGALPCPVEWHGGFSVAVETVRAYPDYRGPACVALAEELAEDGRLDPAILGRAAATGRHDPQELKRVWHHLARFGAPG
jgi:hypothetical protein